MKKIQEFVDEIILNAKNYLKKKKVVYKPIKISGAFSDNFAEYKSNSEKDKSIARYNFNIRDNLRKLIDNKKELVNGKFN